MWFEAPNSLLAVCAACQQPATLHCRRCHKPYCSKVYRRLDWRAMNHWRVCHIFTGRRKTDELEERLRSSKPLLSGDRNYTATFYDTWPLIVLAAIKNKPFAVKQLISNGCDVDEAEEAKVLSDRTQIAATTWENLKPSAMADDYQTQSWFVSNFSSF